MLKNALERPAIPLAYLMNTASAVISFYIRLEERAIGFYEALAQKYNRALFLAFASECKKHKRYLLSVYQQIVTDAIETGFSFTGLNGSDYIFNIKPEPMNYPEALKAAMLIEEKLYKFCADAAEASKSLLTDLSQAFLRIAEKRAACKLELKALYEKAR